MRLSVIVPAVPHGCDTRSCALKENTDRWGWGRNMRPEKTA